MIDNKERLERVSTSEPINVTAALVMSNGVHYEPKINDRYKLHQDECPPLRAWGKDGGKHNPLERDFTGFKKGNIVVIGLYLGDRKVWMNNEARYEGVGRNKWVVRCICGKYETRTTKSLKKPEIKGDPDQCIACDLSTKKIRDKDFKRQYGHWPND